MCSPFGRERGIELEKRLLGQVSRDEVEARDGAWGSQDDDRPRETYGGVGVAGLRWSDCQTADIHGIRCPGPRQRAHVVRARVEGAIRGEDPAAKAGRRIDGLRRQLNALQQRRQKECEDFLSCTFKNRTMSTRRQRGQIPETFKNNAGDESINAEFMNRRWAPRLF